MKRSDKFRQANREALATVLATICRHHLLVLGRLWTGRQ